MGNPPSIPQMEIPPDLKAIYANTVRISHTPAELVFDYACYLPGQSNFSVIDRIIMSPVGAKLFFRAFSENLARFEAAYGEIHLPGDGSLANDLFRAVHPPENPPEA